MSETNKQTNTTQEKSKKLSEVYTSISRQILFDYLNVYKSNRSIEYQNVDDLIECIKERFS